MMTSPSSCVLGIMTTQIEGEPPFLNRDFYRRLTLAGRKAGLSVFVFTPQRLDWMTESVEGYAYDFGSKQWQCQHFPLPDVVYDRCFFSTRQQYSVYRTAIRKLREHRSVHMLGYGLKGKAEVQRMLERDGRFRGHLPQTEIMRSVRSVADWLKAHSQVLLKPQTGSQGRGVLLVQRSAAAQRRRAHTVAAAVLSAQPEPDAAGAARDAQSAPAFAVRGRDAHNRRIARGFADAPALLRWLRRFTAKRSYLLQQYLLLQTQSGDAYDVRSLVQKNGTGEWQVTGMAVRRGQNGSLTSNLHGGGAVEPAEPFLIRRFGAGQAAGITAKLLELSAQIPEALENVHGRLAELGIDFGIDVNGQIWILEVNSKPGRSIFTYLHDDRARSNALTNPIRYARYMLLKANRRALK